MSQNDKLELFSKLFDFEKRGNNYMAKSDGAVITIYQNGNHQIQGKNVDYAKKMIDFLHKNIYTKNRLICRFLSFLSSKATLLTL